MAAFHTTTGIFENLGVQQRRREKIAQGLGDLQNTLGPINDFLRAELQRKLEGILGGTEPSTITAQSLLSGRLQRAAAETAVEPSKKTRQAGLLAAAGKINPNNIGALALLASLKQHFGPQWDEKDLPGSGRTGDGAMAEKGRRKEKPKAP